MTDPKQVREQDAATRQDDSELSDEALEAVAGGQPSLVENTLLIEGTLTADVGDTIL